jgi:hypothetical protein
MLPDAAAERYRAQHHGKAKTDFMDQVAAQQPARRGDQSEQDGGRKAMDET